MRLVLIGLVAGFFSALFGVGGGIVIVPLLLFCGWDSRAATATSLAAIVLLTWFVQYCSAFLQSPSSRNRLVKAAVHWLWVKAVLEPR